MIIFFIIFILYIYICKCLKIYQQNIIKKIKKIYKKKACEKYQNLSKDEKEKKQQYDQEHYKNLSEAEKQKLVEYRKKNRMRKNTLL